MKNDCMLMKLLHNKDSTRKINTTLLANCDKITTEKQIEPIYGYFMKWNYLLYKLLIINLFFTPF
jgi:hypothetical protein